MYLKHVPGTVLDSQSALNECGLLPALCDLRVCACVGREVNEDVFTKLLALTVSLSCLLPQEERARKLGW